MCCFAETKLTQLKQDLRSYYRNTSAYTVKTTSSEAFLLKEYIEERAVEIGNYIIETKATVRQTAKKFGVSKSTVHMEVTIQNGSFG